MVDIRTSDLVDIDAMISPLQKICADCDLYQTDQCRPAACMVGFALRSLQFAKQKGILDIPGALNHIPGTDLKHYFVENIIPALAETCRQCRECQDNHSPDCVIALTRTCLENTILEENIPYPGSIFMYLTLLKKQDPDVAKMLAGELQKGN
ncbi:hypothetical protein [Desulfallas thermosapovorans]|uniref:Uncharacterized protein n=1 Tax=Desulfallas thermosapovorans DSM 6562 TaxID=1121431 RepID=A0A5S4ZYM0_9FIRM|nr:hypothetical protein [Desulfallas thermosapovorans]TYO97955.1 hypothetical protein LX24_00239 [Desulfallas thermosapovorans DSM 6562]